MVEEAKETALAEQYLRQVASDLRNSVASNPDYRPERFPLTQQHILGEAPTTSTTATSTSTSTSTSSMELSE